MEVLHGVDTGGRCEGNIGIGAVIARQQEELDGKAHESQGDMILGREAEIENLCEMSVILLRAIGGLASLSWRFADSLLTVVLLS